MIPGFVDVHTHLREPGFSYKETIKSGSMAGARAGYTTLCTMPNLNPAPDCVENLKVQTDIIERDAVISVLPFGTITKGRKGEGETVDFKSMADKVVGFSDDGTGVQTQELMQKAMEECAKLGKIISAHCEVNDFTTVFIAKNTGIRVFARKVSGRKLSVIANLPKKQAANIMCAIFQQKKALILSARLKHAV